MNIRALHPDFLRAFQNGATFHLKNRQGKVVETYTVQLKDVAAIVLTTGRIVACDPFVLAGDTAPFLVTAPPGTYPVVLSIAMVEPPDERVACAKVQFREGAPVRWEMARKPGQNMAMLKEGQVFGYGVDTGTGCFGDAEALTALDTRLRADQDRKYFAEIVAAQKANGGKWAALSFAPTTPANCVIFSSGWGDGFYTSWWGYDATDEIACFVTDFNVLPH